MRPFQQIGMGEWRTSNFTRIVSDILHSVCLFTKIFFRCCRKLSMREEKSFNCKCAVSTMVFRSCCTSIIILLIPNHWLWNRQFKIVRMGVAIACITSVSSHWYYLRFRTKSSFDYLTWARKSKPIQRLATSDSADPPNSRSSRRIKNQRKPHERSLYLGSWPYRPARKD